MLPLKALSIIALIAAVTYPPKAFAEDASDSKYYQCQSNADCTSISGPCGQPTAVNLEYKGEIEAIFRQLGARMDCAPLPIQPFELRPECSDQGLCFLQATKN